MTVPKAQEDPVLRNFDLRRFKISVKGGRLAIVAPSSMEPLVARMTELDDRRRNERMPFWAEVWPSGVALARMIFKGPDLDSRNVVDLGCGVGVAGAAAAALGASVEFVDFFDEALAFAAFNGRESRRATSRAAISTRLLDWTKARLDRRFDLMLVGDAVYEPSHHEHVLANLESGLATSPGAEAWIVDPCRESADAFFEEASRRFDTDVRAIDTHWPDRRVELRLMVVKRR